MERNNKGESLYTFIDDYTVVDLETTGFSPQYDDIIEIAALRIRNGKIVNKYHQLINPKREINSFISNLTGIISLSLQSKPTLDEVIDDFLEFLGNDIIVGHNVSFDINFIYDNVKKLREKEFTNSYINTVRLSKKLHPELRHHTLYNIAEYYSFNPDDEHRALSDCEVTYLIYNYMKEEASSKYASLDEFYSLFIKKKRNYSFDLTTIIATTDNIDTSNPLYDKVCVFTGVLEKFTRKDAAQLVVNFGGTVENTVTKKTNFLVLGNNDYCKSIKDGKSSKQKKAELYIQKGCDLIIIPEDVFYDMILD